MRSTNTTSESQRDCSSFFKDILKSLTATRKPTQFLRGLPPPFPSPIPHLFRIPVNIPTFLLRVRPFVRDSVVAPERRVIAIRGTSTRACIPVLARVVSVVVGSGI